MPAQTTEKAFETHLEEMLMSDGWGNGLLAEWDVDKALFPVQATGFIRDTQPKLWEQMAILHGSATESMIIDALVKELDIKGSLHVLRHGFKFYGKLFRMAYFKPAHGLSPDVLELYNHNRLTVTRQLPCHASGNCTVDMVLAVNGLPVATIELKNPGTHQTWRDAVRQYKNDRDPRAPVFQFQKRTLVHFAADPDEVHMTTRLEKDKTHFLPFNRGSHPGEIQCGAGNPVDPDGYRTGYFWKETLQRDSFLDILGHFVFIEKRENRREDGHGGHKLVTTEKVIFPRYHQLDSVRKLIKAARDEKAGHNYLVQHSAGSGKTNSISWLSHRLASLHDANDQKVYDCVIVITDRRMLDKQLQDAIYQIEHAQGVVKPIDEGSKQLAAALIDGTKIIITTLQKFPFVLRGLLYATGAINLDNAKEEEHKKAREWQAEIARRRYAVIVDEAHSSQSGESARELKEILGAAAVKDEEGETDWEDRLNEVMASRGKQPNVSFFAFTATPKGKTLEIFGRPGPDGLPRAFHTYSMRQAIEEGFILNVLQNYTTYKSYFQFAKKVNDDPEFPKNKLMQVLMKYPKLLDANVSQKTEIIIEHFQNHVRQRMNGRAKAMVVADSRWMAVKYMLAFEQYLKENNITNMRPLVAFSGTVKDPQSGKEYTEPGMNTDVVSGKTISESQLVERFASSDYQILLVANKYQTGFDQPLLCAMYVDKRLDGVQAVQTLSRLNRKVVGKQEPFVLDFRNAPEDIFKAFKPYYDTTSLQESADPDMLSRLKNDLDMMQVYHWNEVEEFAKVFYKPADQQKAADHAQMQKYLQPAVDRFKDLTDKDKREDFRGKLKSYVRMYSFLSQILPYVDGDLEILYSFARLLIPHLPLDDENVKVRIRDEVELKYHRVERISSGSIGLNIGEVMGVYSPTEVGTGKAEEEKVRLSEIIKALNERFLTDFSEADGLFFDQITAHAKADQQVIEIAKANPLDKFQIGVRKLIEDLMIQRMADNDEIVTRYLNENPFQAVAFPIITREIYQAIVNKKDQKIGNPSS